ncbi:MAG: hypothetical protein IPG55_00145 [Saprospiraceae bacterium]|nr:hypothetical protein [Candidatus Defluviibacterium haderslevense]
MNPAIIYLSNCRDTCSFSQADTCISVCSNKETVYFAVLHSGSFYSWSIFGGLIIGNNNLESVTVSWTAGQVGNITLTETDSTGHSGSISYCVNIFF